MKSCPSCGAESDDAARFCLECGYAYEATSTDGGDPWQGRMVAQRFRIVRKLGDGGMGEVFCAEQVPMGRQVALKVLRQSLSDDPEQVARFKREAQAASQLRHPNTIIVHDFGQDDDGTLFLAMELLEGEPLADVLEGEGTLEPERAARIMAQVCASLQEAHQRGMVHRDLKPENIFLVERGTPDFVKVLDFGIAKVTQGSKGEKLESITKAGAVFGTPHYMAPEQIKGEDIDPRADVYALGVILYRMIAGHLPFNASTVMEMLTKHLTAEPAPIEREGGKGDPAARARLEAVAMRALQKTPDQRQASALAFVEDLMTAMPGLTLNQVTGLAPLAPVGDAPLPPMDIASESPPAGSTSSGAKGALIAVLVLLLLGGAGAAAWWFLLRPAPGPDGTDTPVVMADQGEGGGSAAGGEGEGEGEGGTMVAGAEGEGEGEGEGEVADGADASTAQKVEAARAAEDAKTKAAAEREAAAKAAAEAQAAAEEKAQQAQVAADQQAAQAAVEKARAERERAEAAAAKARAEVERLRAEREQLEAAKAALERQRAEAEAARIAAQAQAAQQQAAQQAAAQQAAQQAAAQRAAGFGRLRIKSKTRGATVFIDGEEKGTTPMRVPVRLSAGQHTIELVKGGKRTKKTVTVKKDDTTPLDLSL